MDNHESHEHEGDLSHRITAYIEHLMDIFEIALAVIVAVAFVISVIPLIKQVPHLLTNNAEEEVFHHFLESTLSLVLGIEFIKMLVKHTPGSVIEVLLFAIARHAILSHASALENLLTILAIAVIFAIRRFIFIENFEYTEGGVKVDWLSDWKEMMKGGGEKKE